MLVYEINGKIYYNAYNSLGNRRILKNNPYFTLFKCCIIVLQMLPKYI